MVTDARKVCLPGGWSGLHGVEVKWWGPVLLSRGATPRTVECVAHRAPDAHAAPSEASTTVDTTTAIDLLARPGRATAASATALAALALALFRAVNRTFPSQATAPRGSTIFPLAR